MEIRMSHADTTKKCEAMDAWYQIRDEMEASRQTYSVYALVAYRPTEAIRELRRLMALAEESERLTAIMEADE